MWSWPDVCRRMGTPPFCVLPALARFFFGNALEQQSMVIRMKNHMPPVSPSAINSLMNLVLHPLDYVCIIHSLNEVPGGRGTVRYV